MVGSYGHTYKFIVLCFDTVDSQPLFSLDLANRPIFLDNVHCTGSEASLLDCGNVIGEHNCNQTDGAGVRCEGKDTIFY